MPSIEANIKTVISVVAGVIQHPVTKKILISKRTKDQHLAGFWEFPGGKVEPGEDLFHALQRELEEELSIYIQSAYPLKQLTHHYPDKAVCLNFYIITHFDKEAESKEGQELEWVELSALNDFEFPAANQPIINSLQLPSFWMITVDCDLNKIDSFIHSIKQSITQFHLKQILFRSKNLSDKEYFLVYEQLKIICDESECLLIVNREEQNLDLSQAWHLTSTQLHQLTERPIEKGLLSASCHTIADIKQAEKIGCDFILLSAVCQTSSHADAMTLGWYEFKKLANQTVLPVYALGGVSRDDLAVARYHGAIGIAGISTFKEHSELI